MRWIFLFFCFTSNICLSQQVKGVDISKSLNLSTQKIFKSDSTKYYTTVVTMGYYTGASLSNPNIKSFGWINYGDGQGRIEIATQEDWYSKYRIYMEK